MGFELSAEHSVSRTGGVHWIALSPHADTRGVLNAIENGEDILFQIQRIYLLLHDRGGPGGHVHRNNQQLVIAVSCRARTILSDEGKTRSYNLDWPPPGLCLYPCCLFGSRTSRLTPRSWSMRAPTTTTRRARSTVVNTGSTGGGEWWPSGSARSWRRVSCAPASNRRAVSAPRRVRRAFADARLRGPLRPLLPVREVVLRPRSLRVRLPDHRDCRRAADLLRPSYDLFHERDVAVTLYQAFTTPADAEVDVRVLQRNSPPTVRVPAADCLALFFRKAVAAIKSVAEGELSAKLPSKARSLDRWRRAASALLAGSTGP